MPTATHSLEAGSSFLEHKKTRAKNAVKHRDFLLADGKGEIHMRKKNAGLTLLELTIVLAIIAIIALIVVPVFLLTSDRARLRADIQSARVIQNAIEQYSIERGASPSGGNVNAIVDHLAGAGYINPRNVRRQTEGAEWVIDSDIGVMVDISGSSADVQNAHESLPESERALVRQ